MLPNFRDHTRTSISKLIQHYTQVEVVVGLKKQFLLDQKNSLAMRSSKQPSDFCHLFSLVKFIQEVTIHFIGLKLSATSKQLSCFRKLHFSQFLTRWLVPEPFLQTHRKAGRQVRLTLNLLCTEQIRGKVKPPFIVFFSYLATVHRDSFA